MRPTSTGHWAVSSVNICVFQPGDAGQLCLPSYGIFSGMRHRMPPCKDSQWSSVGCQIHFAPWHSTLDTFSWNKKACIDFCFFVLLYRIFKLFNFKIVFNHFVINECSVGLNMVSELSNGAYRMKQGWKKLNSFPKFTWSLSFSRARTILLDPGLSWDKPVVQAYFNSCC